MTLNEIAHHEAAHTVAFFQHGIAVAELSASADGGWCRPDCDADRTAV